MDSLLWTLILGGLAGWLAGKITRGTGFGILGNIIIGIVGSIIGHFGFALLGITTATMLGDLLFAVLGAIALVFVIGKARRV